jgi:uncharacterized integral membrane protein
VIAAVPWTYWLAPALLVADACTLVGLVIAYRRTVGRLMELSHQR